MLASNPTDSLVVSLVHERLLQESKPDVIKGLIKLDSSGSIVFVANFRVRLVIGYSKRFLRLVLVETTRLLIVVLLKWSYYQYDAEDLSQIVIIEEVLACFVGFERTII